MKKHSFLLLLLLYPLFLKAPTEKTNAPAIAIPTYANSGDVLRSFLKPVHFSRDGINTFFTTIFNSTLYAEFLGSCFVHIDDFIVHGIEHDKPYSYYESVFMLFHHRIKESNWVNPYALLLFLDQISERVPHILKSSAPDAAHLVAEELKKIIENTPAHKINNDWYIKTAQQLTNTLQSDQSNNSMRELHKSIALLVESSCNKLIWSPTEQAEIWDIVKLLCKKCENLYQIGCIESLDDANRLIWSILYRFGYFIDVAGAQLPNAFYHNIRMDLDKELPSFLRLEEQETWITKKIEYLSNTLTRAEIKNSITQQGLLGDIVKKA